MQPPEDVGHALLQLEPFVHQGRKRKQWLQLLYTVFNEICCTFLSQVGGHFPMICLDKTIVCKPLNVREHSFYQSLQSMPNHLEFVHFTPTFHGTMQVETKEDEDGYIQLKGQPPPSYLAGKRQAAAACTGFGANTYYRLKRKESIEIETVSEEELEDATSPRRTTAQDASAPHPGPAAAAAAAGVDVEGEAKNNGVPTLHDAADPCAGPASQRNCSNEFYNPWALKCHRAYLKKLGLLSGVSSNRDSAGEAASSSEENSSSVDKDREAKKAAGSRSNPQTYLLLENLVSRYRYPCILDLKVGSRQYADYNSDAKKQRKIDKAKNTTLNSLKLRLGGMQVYKLDTGHYVCRDKYFGRSLDDDGFYSALRDFLTNSDKNGIRLDVLRGLRDRVQSLERVLSGLETFRFYTSSLLVTYDGTSNGAQNGIDLRIIDFAHSTHQGLKDQYLHQGPDEDFIQGLRNLVRILFDIEQHATSSRHC